jgi:hypothetical protein
MRFDKKLIAIIPLTLLIWLLNIYVEDLYHWLTGDYLSTIEHKIPYKVLLQICIGLLTGTVVCLAFLVLIFRSKNNVVSSEIVKANSPKSSNPLSESDIRRHRENLLRNLAEDEKVTLRMFINEKQKNVRIVYGHKSVSSLLANGIIIQLTQVTVFGTVEYSITDWAWEMLKESQKYLK